MKYVYFKNACKNTPPLLPHSKILESTVMSLTLLSCAEAAPRCRRGCSSERSVSPWRSSQGCGSHDCPPLSSRRRGKAQRQNKASCSPGTVWPSGRSAGSRLCTFLHPLQRRRAGSYGRFRFQEDASMCRYSAMIQQLLQFYHYPVIWLELHINTCMCK